MEQEQWPTIIALTVCLGATTAAAVAASIYWRKQRKSTGKGIRKRLAVTPGIRVVKSQDTPTESNGSSGWGGLIGKGASSGKGEATKWEQSKKKGDLGYYFAHHTSHKELAPEEYQMNGPKLLSKGGGAPAAATNCSKSAGSSSPSPVVTQRRRAQQITSYSWEDYGEEVRLTFRQPGWDWGKVEAGEIGVEWGPRRFRMSIDSREYGLHTIDLQTLSGEVRDVRVVKMKSRLIVALVKGGRGSYSMKAPWEKLQSPPEKRSNDM